jgi:hypothetical protein
VLSEEENQAAKAKKLLEAKKKANSDASQDDGFNPLIPILTLVLIGGVMVALIYTQWYQSDHSHSSADRFAKMVRDFFSFFPD